MKVKYKLVLIVMLLGLIMIALAGTTYYLLSKQIVEDRINDQLHSVAILKSDALQRMIDDAATDIELVLSDSVLDQIYAHSLTRHNIDDTSALKVYDNIRDSLLKKSELSNKFDMFYIVSPDGEVHLSTDTQQEGKFKSDEPYFIEGKKGTYAQVFYYDISLQRPEIAVSAPIIDNNGTFIGVLVGMLNIQRVEDLMLQRSGLGNTGETYLVNEYNYMLTDSRFESGSAMKKKIKTPAVEKCLTGGVGELIYNGYRDVPVIGYYRWLPDQHVCLIAEIDQEEAYQPVQNLLGRILLISFTVFFIFIMLTLLMVRTFTRPIIKLSDAALKIDAGNLDVPIDIHSKDEFGDLAAAFRQMINNLKISGLKLHEYSKNLEKQVKDRTKQLDSQVSYLEDNKAALMNMMEDFEEALETQKRLERIKTEFLSVTSHELRTPITPMRAQLQMVLGGYMGKITAEQKKSLDLVLNNTTRLDRLIGDILDISKLQSGVMKFVIQKANLNEVVKGAVDTMKMKATDRGINVKLKSQDIPLLNIDKDRLTQVVVNLINNAIKFTDVGGIITIEVINDKNHTTVKVIDTGIGIPKYDCDRIFRPFEQVDSSRSRNYEGTGLGLAICQGIIIQHGGKIWVESEPGKGSSFIFTIPFKPTVNVGQADIELFHVDKKATVRHFREIANKEGYMINEDFIDEMIKKGAINDKGDLSHGISFKELDAEGYVTKMVARQVKKKEVKSESKKEVKSKLKKEVKEGSEQEYKKEKKIVNKNNNPKTIKGGKKNGKDNVRR